jgi:GTP-binding protein
MIPKIAIIGRPNVGKSTLFNRIVKRKKAIVQDKPGITRDRLYGKTKYEDRDFIVIDTGGYDTGIDNDSILNVVKKQIFNAIDEADALIFLLDGKSGLSTLDIEINESLRFVEKPVFYVVNKIDGEKFEDNVYDFYRLGVEKLYKISAEHKLGITELISDLIEVIPEKKEIKEEEQEIIKIAIIGRPNVGKSSIINKLLNEERVIVSEVPGTTRDSVDTLLIKDTRKYLLIDTAGIRGKSKVKKGVESYSVQAALKSIRRCDIVVLAVDAVDGVVEQDTKIAGYANEMGKACMIVVNKWDLVDKEGFLYKDFLNTVYDKLKYLRYAPIISTSVVTNLRIDKILRIADTIDEEYNKRIPTSKINLLLTKLVAKHPPPIVKNKAIKFYYMTQVKTKPPRFVIFSKHPKLVHFSYERYIINQIRKEHKFIGCPIVIEFRQRRSIYK